MKLTALIKQRRFSSVGLKAVLNIAVTESWINGQFSEVVSGHGLTRKQYNVLRILRGSHPEPLTCSSVAERLLDRTPDVTRLLVRLERESLVSRRWASYDQRVVEVFITEKGRALLTSLDEPIDNHIDELTRHLSEGDLAMLCDLLERLRTDQT